MSKSALLAVILSGAILITSCKKDNTAPATVEPPIVNPCVGVTVLPIADFENTITGQSLGTITVKSPIGSGITYSIGGGIFQPSPNFFNLPVGTYSISVKTAAGCVGTSSATITSYGAKYYAVRSLIKNNCGPCHLNGTSSGAKNFDTDASIVAAWDRIKARAVDNLPTVMPQSGALTIPDKQKITDWIAGGHTTSN
jgi:hypothetical protein